MVERHASKDAVLFPWSTAVTHRPIIGIASQTQESAGDLPRCWIMGQRYIHALTSAGAVPWVIPLVADDLPTLRSIYERLDGLFLTGGVDVDPAQYGAARNELCGRIDPARDAVELCLIRWALEDHKPVLGACRGIQVINVACGGTLYQDVGAEMPRAIKHDYFPHQGNFRRDQLVHDVSIDLQSRLGRACGVERCQVNSMHHQGIKELGRGLAASAFAPDGLIEGIEGTNGHFLLGVQWHPEELVDTQPNMRRLFQSFIEAAVR
jgi:putative glutamine amidotransferase